MTLIEVTNTVLCVIQFRCSKNIANFSYPEMILRNVFVQVKKPLQCFSRRVRTKMQVTLLPISNAFDVDNA